jgi:hypothetical protein
MTLITLIVGLALMFLSGMHFVVWHKLGGKNSIYWCIALGGMSLYTIVAAIGRLTSV